MRIYLKTEENPATKNIEFNSMMPFFGRIKVASSLFSLISANDTPDKKEIYPGTNGKTQGDKKEINPAANAIYIEKSGIFYKL
jgi:hypothetical protein